YIVLNLADDNSWQTITHDFVHLYLDCNYPPTQAWFDEGLAEYFSSLKLTDQAGEIGGDPNSYLPLLAKQPWLPLPELFATHLDITPGKEVPGKPIFQAESWIVIHYLLAQNKLPETGAYFDLVQNQGVPAEQAIQKAYGMNAAELQKAIKDYSV